MALCQLLWDANGAGPPSSSKEVSPALALAFGQALWASCCHSIFANLAILGNVVGLISFIAAPPLPSRHVHVGYVSAIAGGCLRCLSGSLAFALALHL